MNARELDDDIEGVAAAHLRLLQHLDGLVERGELDPTTPSLLPDWTVGHVLTHLARNADGLRGMIEAAGRGEEAPMYPGGPAQRSGDIDAGAQRCGEDLVADARTAIWKLDAAWVGLSAEGWAGNGRMLNGTPVPITGLPFVRWREVEIHHVDLGLDGFGIDDWSAAFVAKELGMRIRHWKSRRPMGLTDLPPAINALTPQRRLAWFVGRLRVVGVEDPGPWA